ncbi:hypothetical protein P5V15_000797 [Pogonomyrmex californicus]
MQTHKPPTLFRLFLSLLDLQTALPLLRTETATPPTVANTFGGDESDEGSERASNDDDDDNDNDDSASKIESSRVSHASRLCRLLRSQTDV